MPAMQKEDPKAPNMPDDRVTFTLENLQKLPNLLGARGAPTADNFRNLKIAFQPFGQSENPLTAQKQAEWQKQLAAFKSKDGAKTWPHEVPSFELWAAATSYKPGESDGGVQFQNMMQHLLVANGSQEPVFNDEYYSSSEKRRSDAWYKYQPSFSTTAPYKEGPHTLRGSYHTPATQGAWLGGEKGDGGATGVDNNNTKPRQINEAAIATFHIAVPVKPASKTNWLYHCLGIAVNKEDKDAAGNNNSANQFVTDGTLKNCGEDKVKHTQIY